jgi:hypothetical protein
MQSGLRCTVVVVAPWHGQCATRRASVSGLRPVTTPWAPPPARPPPWGSRSSAGAVSGAGGFEKSSYIRRYIVKNNSARICRLLPFR